MSKGIIVVLSLILATMASGIADARPDRDDGDGYRDRAMTSRKVARRSGSSTACLTSEARNLLARIRTKFSNVEIISTCRPGARIAGTGRPSKHASGQAIDFRVPGRKAEVVRWLIAHDRTGGIMTYRDMDHIHVDVGPHFVALNAASGRT